MEAQLEKKKKQEGGGDGGGGGSGGKRDIMVYALKHDLVWVAFDAKAKR